MALRIASPRGDTFTSSRKKPLNDLCEVQIMSQKTAKRIQRLENQMITDKKEASMSEYKFTFEDYREALEGVGPAPVRTSWPARSRTKTLSSRSSSNCAS